MIEHKIAKRYANALYTHVKESSPAKAQELWDELHQFAALVDTNKDFYNVIKNPAISIEEKQGVFKALNQSGKLSSDLCTFLLLLVEKQRLSILADISREIKELTHNEENKVEAVAVFAHKANETVKAELVSRLEKLTGKTVVLKEEIDESLIGGVRVTVGNSLYDASIKGQIDKLKSTLSYN